MNMFMSLIEVLIKFTCPPPPPHGHQIQRGTIQSCYQWRADLNGQHLPGANVVSALQKTDVECYCCKVHDLLADRMDGLM